MSRSTLAQTHAILATAVAALVAAGCGGGASPAADVGDAAQRVYVAPGQYDEFYFFASGGFSGQVAVYGLPSGRLLKVVPVFSQNAENAWGYSEQTKAMLNTSYGFVPWDDSHHPELSMTNGVPDGRWLFINGNNTPRVARLDLTTFETVEILEIPHSAGNHASPFITENTEYAVAATRFSVPTPQEDVAIANYKEKFRGTISFVKVDSTTGRMDIAFQILMPGFNYDLAHSGKGPSHGWSFFTSYNTEQANTLLEVNASQNDKDFVAAVNWKQAEECVAEGKAKAVPAEYAHNCDGRRPRRPRSTEMEKCSHDARARRSARASSTTCRRPSRRTAWTSIPPGSTSWRAGSWPRSFRCTRSRRCSRPSRPTISPAR